MVNETEKIIVYTAGLVTIKKKMHFRPNLIIHSAHARRWLVLKYEKQTGSGARGDYSMAD